MAKRKISSEHREQRKKLLEMLQDAGINDYDVRRDGYR
jgi:hypothetical protein